MSFNILQVICYNFEGKGSGSTATSKGGDEKSEGGGKGGSKRDKVSRHNYALLWYVAECVGQLQIFEWPLYHFWNDSYNLPNTFLDMDINIWNHFLSEEILGLFTVFYLILRFSIHSATDFAKK